MSGHERERLSAYLDRELPPDERAAVEAHLAACPECAGFLAELAAVDEAAASLPAEAPEGYFGTFPARVRARLRAPKSASPPRRVPVWTWAAAAALLLAVVTPLTLRQRRPAPSEAPLAQVGVPESVPAVQEPKAAALSSRLEPRPTAAPARPGPRASVPPVAATPAAAATAAPPSKDEGSARPFFAPEPGAPPPPEEGVAAPSTMADAESRVVGGVASESAANREKSVRGASRPAAAAEAVSPTLSAASPGGAVPPADVQEQDDVFHRLEAVRPRSAPGWRRLRDQWSAVAALETDPLRADEARVRAIVAAREAWRAGGDASDEAAFRREAGAYLRREDARQKPRVERLLAEP